MVFCIYLRGGKCLDIIPASIWCCGDRYQELSERSTLIDIDLVNSFQEYCTGAIDIELNHEGTCDTIILWMDTFIDEDRKFQVITPFANTNHPY